MTAAADQDRPLLNMPRAELARLLLDGDEAAAAEWHARECPQPPRHELTPCDRQALEWARALSRCNWTIDDLRRIYQLHNDYPVAERAGYEDLQSAVVARASVFLGELAGLVARLTGEDV